MSFNLSKLTHAPALTIGLSALSLSVITGCSSMTGDSTDILQMFSNKEPVADVNPVDPYDAYYGSPKRVSYDSVYKPKIIRTVSKPVFKHNSPQRYIVKKGDTLWGISNKFLSNPSYWPEVWDKNQKVQNPHRIYPGDELYIYHGRKNIKVSDGSIIEKLVPQLRIIRSGGGEPISTLSPFLAWPRVLDDDTINNAPYIVDARDANLLIEEDQTVYVKKLADQHAGGEYAIFNIGDIVYDPETKREFGHEVVYNGFLEVERPAIPAEVATALVIDSKREIRRGDRLLWVEDHTHSLKTPISIPSRKIRGSIISLFDAQMITGQSQIITVNKGSKDGIKLGNTLGVYSPAKRVDDPIEKTGKQFYEPVVAAKVGIPPERSATAIVYKVLDDISYALITDSSHEVKHGYKIGNP